MEKASEKPKIVCPCGKQFKEKSGYYKHCKKCTQATKLECSSLPRKPCKEDNCNFSYRYMDEFRRHLESAHNLNMVCEVLMFRSYDDFMIWKEEYEIKTVSSFTRNNIKKTDKSTGPVVLRGRATEYYYCHRSGQYKCSSKGKRKLKAQGSLKINTTCTATLKVTTLPDNTVRAFVCHTHYGHKMELVHVKIPKKERQYLADQLSKGVPKERILQNLSASNALTLERKHLIMRKDLNNISRAYGMVRQDKCKQFRLSVDNFYEDVIKDGTVSVLLYKRKLEDEFVAPDGLDCPFGLQDFVFAFMNQVQQDSLKTFGNGVVCFDETADCEQQSQNTSEFDCLKIFSVTVIDEYGDGIPVAWLISNRADMLLLTFFFKQIKELIGNINPKALMSHRTTEVYKCWQDVFEGEPASLLCPWHVYNEWQDKISSLVADQDAASLCYQVLCLLLEEKDMAKFVILMQKCMKEMNGNKSLIEFGRHFCEEWVEIQDRWAICFRSELGMDTNCHIEAVHQTFKNQFIQEKFKKSPNKCLSLVLNFTSELYRNRHERHAQDKLKLLDDHRLVSHMSGDAVQEISPTTWYVTASDSVYSSTDKSTGTLYSLVYVVELVVETCERVCSVKCAECEVCMHMYKCSCNDPKLAIEICQHIHLVAFCRMQASVPTIQDGPIIIEEEPNGTDFGMLNLDHTYFDTHPNADGQTVANPRSVLNVPSGGSNLQNISISGNIIQNIPTIQTASACSFRSETTRVSIVPKEQIVISQPDKRLAVAGNSTKTPKQSDKSVGIPTTILPKPQVNYIVPKELGILNDSHIEYLGVIILPRPTPTLDSNTEALKRIIQDDVTKLISKIKSCTSRKALLAVQRHINAAYAALQKADNNGPKIAS